MKSVTNIGEDFYISIGKSFESEPFAKDLVGIGDSFITGEFHEKYF